MPKKSFSVFGGAHWRPLNTLKLIFGKMFYYFWFTLLKNTFAIFSRFFFLQYVELSVTVRKELFLDVNLKTMFFVGQNHQSPQN